MKCWKCGAYLPENTSVCTYCGTSTRRRNPVTAQGRAMRQAYDHFGAQKVFARNSVLPAALGDLLEDSKTLRNQIDIMMDVGVGNVYLEQLQSSGKPDEAFYNRVRTLMCDEAGLSGVLAQRMTDYLDEMIGWEKPVKKTAPPPPPKPEGQKPAAGTSTSRTQTPPERIKTPPQPPRPQPKPVQQTRPPQPPRPAQTPVKPAGIPLPTKPVPHESVNWLGMIIVAGLFIGGIAAAYAGALTEAACMIVGSAVLIRVISPPLPKKVTANPNNTQVILTWEGAIEKFAVAVNNTWVLTGSGTKAAVPNNVFVGFKPGEKIYVTLASIEPGGEVKRMGEVTLQYPKK